MQASTTETLFDGRLTLCQPREGYRYSMDSVVLAAHIEPCPGDRLLDIGTGVGIMPLILGFRNPTVRITGIEIQEDLARLAGKNVRINGMADRITILHRDARCLLPGHPPFHRVIANPPYIPLGHGRLNPDPRKAVARHEVALTLEDLAGITAASLEPEGFCHLIYPSGRARELVRALDMQGITILWTRSIHPAVGREAKRVIVTGVKARKPRPEPEVRPPFFLLDELGRMTGEAETRIRG